MRLLIPAGLALALCLAACSNDKATAAGGISEGEAKALEEAASMLDERRLPPEAVSPKADPSASPAELTGDAAPLRN